MVAQRGPHGKRSPSGGFYSFALAGFRGFANGRGRDVSSKERPKKPLCVLSALSKVSNDSILFFSDIEAQSKEGSCGFMPLVKVLILWLTMLQGKQGFNAIKLFLNRKYLLKT